MADNFLEKRQEAYREQAAKGIPKRVNSVIKLAERSVTLSFDAGYKVRVDQLQRIVSAGEAIGGGAGVGVGFHVVSDRDSLLLTPFIDERLRHSLSYIILGVVDVDKGGSLSVLLGRTLQMMLLQAAEIGLAAAIVSDFDSKRLSDTISLPFTPVVIIAVGKGVK